MFLNIAMSCSASTSCRQSSPTLKIAWIHTSCSVRRSSSPPSPFNSESGSASMTTNCFRTLNDAMNGACKTMSRPNHVKRKAPNLGMALERSARLLIYVDNFPVRIAWKINADVDFYFRHFLIDLSLSSSLSTAHFYLLNWVYLLL